MSWIVVRALTGLWASPGTLAGLILLAAARATGGAARSRDGALEACASSSWAWLGGRDAYWANAFEREAWKDAPSRTTPAPRVTS